MIESFYPSTRLLYCDQNCPCTYGLTEKNFPSIENSNPPWYHKQNNPLKMAAKNQTERKILEKNYRKTHHRVHGSLTFYQCLLDYLHWWKNNFVLSPSVSNLASDGWKTKSEINMLTQYPQPDKYSKPTVPKRSHRIRLLPSLGKDNFKRRTRKIRDKGSKKTLKQKETVEKNKVFHVTQNVGEKQKSGDLFSNPFRKNNFSVVLSKKGCFTIYNSTNIDKILKTNAFLEDRKRIYNTGKKNPNFFKTKMTQHKYDLIRKDPKERVTKKDTIECFKRFMRRPLSSASIAMASKLMLKNNKTRVKGLSRLLKTFSNKVQLFDEYKIIADGVEIKTPCISLVSENDNRCVENNIVRSACQQCILTARNWNQTLPYKVYDKSLVNFQCNVKDKITEKPTLLEKACELLLCAEKIATKKSKQKNTKPTPHHYKPFQKRQSSLFETKRKSTKPSSKVEKRHNCPTSTSAKRNETKCTCKYLQLNIPSTHNETKIVSTHEDKKTNRRIKLFEKKNKIPVNEEQVKGKITKCLIPAVQFKHEANIISFDLDCIREQCRNNRKNNNSGRNHNSKDLYMKEQDKSKMEKIKKYLNNFPSMTNEQIKSIVSNSNPRQTQSLLCIPLCSDGYYYIDSKDHDPKPVKCVPSCEGKLSDENIKLNDEEIELIKQRRTTQQDKKDVKQFNSSKDLSCKQDTRGLTKSDDNEPTNAAVNDNSHTDTKKNHSGDNASRKRYIIEIEDSNSQILNEIIEFIEAKEESLKASSESLSYCTCHLKDQRQSRTKHEERYLEEQSQTDLKDCKCSTIEEDQEKELSVKTYCHDYALPNSSKDNYKRQEHPSHHKQNELSLKCNKFHQKVLKQKQPKSCNINHKSTTAAKNIWTKALSTLGTKVQKENSKQKHLQQHQPKIKENDRKSTNYKKMLQSINKSICNQNYGSFNDKKVQKIEIKNKLQSYNRNRSEHKMYSPYNGDQCKIGLQYNQTQQCGTAYKQYLHNETQKKKNCEIKCEQCLKVAQQRQSTQNGESFIQQPFSRYQQKKVYLQKQNDGDFQDNQAQQKNDTEQKSYYMRNQEKVNERTNFTNLNPKQTPDYTKNKQQQEYGTKFDKFLRDLHNRQLIQSSHSWKKQQEDKNSEIPALGQNSEYQKKQQQFTKQTGYLNKEKQYNNQERIQYLENYLKGYEEYTHNEYIQSPKKYRETSQIMNLQMLNPKTGQKNHQKKLKRLEREQGLQCLEQFIEEYEKELESDCQHQEEINLELYKLADHKRNSFVRMQELKNQQRLQYLEKFLEKCEKLLNDCQRQNKKPLAVKAANYSEQQRINEAMNRLQKLKQMKSQQRMQKMKKSLKGRVRLHDECKDENKRPLEPLQIENQTYQGNPPKMKRQQQLKKFEPKCKICPKDHREHQYGVLQNQNQPKDNQKHLQLDQKFLIDGQKKAPPQSNKYRGFQDINKQKTNFIICRRCVYSNLIYTLPAKLRRLSPLIDENSKYLQVCLICEDKNLYHIPSIPSEQEMHSFNYGRYSSERDELDCFPVYFRPPVVKVPSQKKYPYWMMRNDQDAGDGSELCVHSHGWFNSLESSYGESGLGNSRSEGDFVILNENMCYSYGAISIQCLDRQVGALNKLFRG